VDGAKELSIAHEVILLRELLVEPGPGAELVEAAFACEADGVGDDEEVRRVARDCFLEADTQRLCGGAVVLEVAVASLYLLVLQMHRRER